MWIDETNFNLFCRRGKGWSAIGNRSVVLLPNSKGPNVHVIGAISTEGMEHVQVRRGSYRWESANEFIINLVGTMERRGVDVNRVVLICDNAPCHARLERAVETVPGLVLLRLSPYSPMLNPIENVWSKLKSVVKRNNRVPVVHPPGVMEQRLVYLELLIQNALGEVTTADCTRSIQHSVTFHPLALGLMDMPVGR